MDGFAGMQGKICLVTGGSAGIGKATAIELATLGARVILVARQAEKAAQARDEIIRRSSNQEVDLILADLSLMDEVRNLAAAVASRYPHLDVLINNAAVYKASRQTTAEGLEVMFATNYLAPFLLTHLLIDALAASGGGQIINVTAPSTDQIDFVNLQGNHGFSPLTTFSRTKMALLLFTFELARRLSGMPVRVNAVYPGLAHTELMREARFRVKVFIYLSSYPTKRAAQAVIDLIRKPARELEIPSGGFYYEGKEAALDPYTLDKEIQGRLWDASAALAGL